MLIELKVRKPGTLLRRMSGLALVLVALTGVSGDAFALGSAPIPGGPAPGGNRYSEGYALGQRNGTLISQRLYDRTVKTSGCSQLDAYQAGLLNVNRSIRVPNLTPDTDQELVKGFFRGYLDAVRKSIRDSRNGCKKLKFESGTYPGQFYGSLLCQAIRVNVDLVQTLEVVPLYDNWSGGNAAKSRQCETQGTVEVRSCGFPDQTPLPATVVASLRTACRN